MREIRWDMVWDHVVTCLGPDNIVSFVDRFLDDCHDQIQAEGCGVVFDRQVLENGVFGVDEDQMRDLLVSWNVEVDDEVKVIYARVIRAFVFAIYDGFVC